LNETLKEEFRLNPDTFYLGPGLAIRKREAFSMLPKACSRNLVPNACFNGPYRGRFHPGNGKWDEPVSVISSGIVVEGAEFADYFWPAMEQFVEITHDYWRSNGQFFG